MALAGVWWVIAALTSVVRLSAASSEPSIGRSSCSAASNFEGSKQDWALVGHVIDAFLVRDELQCAHKCLSREYCQSYNYGYIPGDDGHVCELNRNNARESPGSFRASHGLRYYEPAVAPNMVNCQPKCQNGGKCIDVLHVPSCRPQDRFKCDCPVDFEGRHCEVVAARSCQELKRRGATLSGEYVIQPEGLGPVKVHCDQTTDGGGWTVIQVNRRERLNFTKDWDEYRKGFGDASGEQWLGNDVIHSLTPAQLLIELRDSQGNRGFALYQHFQVSDSRDKFRLNITRYNGTIGDAITNNNSNDRFNQNDMQFTTFDEDNDRNPRKLCGGGGGWWLNFCGYANLNNPNKIKWDSWRAVGSIVSSTMKIRQAPHTGSRGY